MLVAVPHVSQPVPLTLPPVAAVHLDATSTWWGTRYLSLVMYIPVGVVASAHVSSLHQLLCTTMEQTQGESTTGDPLTT